MNDTSFESFSDSLAKQRIVPVKRTLFYDLETPVGLYRRVTKGAAGTFLLESADSGVWSRFSFIGLNPYGIISTENKLASWKSNSLSESELLPDQKLSDLNPLQALEAIYSRWKTPETDQEAPLAAGLVGFIGWETIRELEKISEHQKVDYQLPTQLLFFAPDLIVFDHKLGTLELVSSVLNPDLSQSDVSKTWEAAQDRLDSLEQLILTQAHDQILQRPNYSSKANPIIQIEKSQHLANIAKAKEYIAIGDAFQIVVSQRFDHELSASAIDVYRSLRALNPSPYLYLISAEKADGEPFQIVGSSPEALIKISGKRVLSHPIAGSRPRGGTVEEDEAFANSLIADNKEKSEHVMLVDLARNDLLKVCKADSVAVLEFMKVEKFSHIMHLVSTVVGELRADASPVAALAAAFPAGTLSGAPKPRALEIITELESTTRNVYGGVVGYIDFSGSADLAIAIRTATLHDTVATVQSGGGIVADSDPEAEYQETVNKAAAPLRAIAFANALEEIDKKVRID